MTFFEGFKAFNFEEGVPYFSVTKNGVTFNKAGCFGSVMDMSLMPFNFKSFVHKGMMQEECTAALKEFFKNLRSRRN